MKQGGFLFKLMKNKIIVALLITLACPFNLIAQEGADWNGRKCAVVLTYDDALNVHLDNVIPVLDSLDFKATFYLPGRSPVLNDRISEWRTAASNGHELGNHTLFHPCHGKSMDRDWVNPDYDLDDYTPGRIASEIRVANTLLKAIDGKEERTFAYSCGENTAGDSIFTDLIRDKFVAARTTQVRMNKLDETDLFNLGAMGINGQSGEELIERVKEAKAKGALIIFLFHGVGGEHSLNVALEEHNKLLYFLKRNEKDIWVAPLVNVAKYMATCKRPATGAKP